MSTVECDVAMFDATPGGVFAAITAPHLTLSAGVLPNALPVARSQAELARCDHGTIVTAYYAVEDTAHPEWGIHCASLLYTEADLRRAPLREA
ncbi:MAG: hypothetical protein HY332_22495 [Chloroflexi bacterium]|nr:hypothetical protein [Chloroflexota bacterium]